MKHIITKVQVRLPGKPFVTIDPTKFQKKAGSPAVENVNDYRVSVKKALNYRPESVWLTYYTLDRCE